MTPIYDPKRHALYAVVVFITFVFAASAACGYLSVVDGDDKGYNLAWLVGVASSIGR